LGPFHRRRKCDADLADPIFNTDAPWTGIDSSFRAMTLNMLCKSMHFRIDSAREWQ